tara:strand:- start:610 stop:1245 length:636 start_codon:yes stop_codon:yes gene_type:complete
MIDKTACIGDKVKIGNNVYIGKYCIIEGDVEIGDNTTISHFCTIGTPAQTVPTDYVGKIIIGKNNIIREYVSINMPAKDATVIGNNNLIMCGLNIGHDVKIGNNVVVCIGARLGGHSIIGDNVKLGMNCCIHQFVKIGSNTMIGMGSQVRINIPPFSIVENDKVGFDLIGTKRSNKYNVGEAKKAYLQYKIGCFDMDKHSEDIKDVYKKFI